MKRRDFCKLAPAAVIMAALNPAKAVAMAFRCSNTVQPASISVVRCECYGDLQARFGTDPDAGPCRIMHTGMKWKLHEWQDMPAGMCPHAWNAIRNCIDCRNNTCNRNINEMLVSCPDGSRPVIFKIQFT